MIFATLKIHFNNYGDQNAKSKTTDPTAHRFNGGAAAKNFRAKEQWFQALHQLFRAAVFYFVYRFLSRIFGFYGLSNGYGFRLF